MGKRKHFLWEINDQQRLQRPSFSYVEAKHLVSNQDRLQEIAEMTELRQIDKAVRSRFYIGRDTFGCLGLPYGCVSATFLLPLTARIPEQSIYVCLFVS